MLPVRRQPVLFFRVIACWLNPSGAAVTRAQLLSARQISAGSINWELTKESGKMALKPFEAITPQETYRLYHNVTA